MIKPIEKNVTMAAPIEQVWAALTDPAAIGAWMDDEQAALDLCVGGAVAFFGGATTGAVTKRRKPNALEYTWRQDEWPAKWRDSVVRWKLTRAGAGTKVHLTHDTFPNQAERDSHDEGWDVYWLEPMQAWLEKG